jgi:ornithine cyclodeaminase
MLIVDAETTRAHLGFAPLIEALRAMFISGCVVPPRHVHAIGPADTLLLMPAWRPGARLGLKAVTIFPGNAALDRPALHSVYLLFDARSGVPLAQLDGNEITSRRTAAASALAASFLARPDARRLLVVGSGRVAALLPDALRVVRPIDQVTVWNHRGASATTLAARLREAGIDASATVDLAAAVAQADIVSCATLATAPLIRAEWLRPGTHLDLIGSYTPQMCEADAPCFAQCRVYVDTDEALLKSGDLLRAIAAQAFGAEQLQGTLAQLCTGLRRGRDGAAQRTLFKSVGSALEDLAAAELVWAAVAGESVCFAPSPCSDSPP